MSLTDGQREALARLCDRYNVEFDESNFLPAWDLPKGWVSGWVGGNEERCLYVGCSPEGEIHS